MRTLYKHKLSIFNWEREALKMTKILYDSEVEKKGIEKGIKIFLQ